MSTPSFDDANVLLQIEQWFAIAGINDATHWIWSDEFDPNYTTFVEKHPIGSEGYGKVRKALNAYETVAALWKNGLFNEKLLFDWKGVNFLWDRVEVYVLGMRERAGNDTLYENLEALAAAAPD